MKSVSASETLVSFYQATRYFIPEDSHLHTSRSEYLRNDLFKTFSCVMTILLLPA